MSPPKVSPGPDPQTPTPNRRPSTRIPAVVVRKRLVWLIVSGFLAAILSILVIGGTGGITPDHLVKIAPLLFDAYVPLLAVILGFYIAQGKSTRKATVSREAAMFMGVVVAIGMLLPIVLLFVFHADFATIMPVTKLFHSGIVMGAVGAYFGKDQREKPQ